MKPECCSCPCALLLAVIVVSALLVFETAANLEHVQMHSFAPPMLADYWENGLHYWSFGSSSVVTDDYVRLTTKKEDAKGYFWNRHPNHLDSFLMNTTLRFKHRKSGWFADATDGGFGLWYTAATPRHMPTSLFGNVDTFEGLGVILDHSDAISVVVNEGEHIRSLVKDRRGECQVKDLGENKITITVIYNAEAKEVEVIFHLWIDEHTVGHDVACTVVHDVVLPVRNYFGVTASNSVHAQAEHDLVSFFVRPMGGDSKAVEEEEEDVGLHLFDHARERKLQNEWNGRADEPLSKERPAVNKESAATEKDGSEAEEEVGEKLEVSS